MSKLQHVMAARGKGEPIQEYRLWGRAEGTEGGWEEHTPGKTVREGNRSRRDNMDAVDELDELDELGCLAQCRVL